jgi:hypothetical protein
MSLGGQFFMSPDKHLTPHRFVGDVEVALGQQFFDIAVAAEIEPDCVLDDLGREPMAAITGQGHADILPYSATDPVSVTMPGRERQPVRSVEPVDIDGGRMSRGGEALRRKTIEA